MKRINEIGEFGLIDRIRQIVNKGKGVIKGIGDDTAVTEYDKRKFLLLTTDMLIEGVHFRKTDSPETRKIASFNPPSSDGLDSRSSVFSPAASA